MCTERRNYELTPNHVARLRAAAQPDATMEIDFKSGITIYTPKDTRAASNEVRRQIAAELGYDPETVVMTGVGYGFTAVPIEPQS